MRFSSPPPSFVQPPHGASSELGTLRPSSDTFHSASPKPHPSKPHPCRMPPAKTEVALQFSDCCAAEVALQHSVFCSADVNFTKSCAAASEKLQCNIGIPALQESGAFLPLSCGFQAPTFRHPRLGSADPLFLMGYRVGSARYVAEWDIAQICLYK